MCVSPWVCTVSNPVRSRFRLHILNDTDYLPFHPVLLAVHLKEELHFLYRARTHTLATSLIFYNCYCVQIHGVSMQKLLNRRLSSDVMNLHWSCSERSIPHSGVTSSASCITRRSDACSAEARYPASSQLNCQCCKMRVHEAYKSDRARNYASVASRRVLVSPWRSCAWPVLAPDANPRYSDS